MWLTTPFVRQVALGYDWRHIVVEASPADMMLPGGEAS